MDVKVIICSCLDTGDCLLLIARTALMCRSKTCIWDRRDQGTQMRLPLHFSSDMSCNWTRSWEPPLSPPVLSQSCSWRENSMLWDPYEQQWVCINWRQDRERFGAGLVLTFKLCPHPILSFPSPAKPFAQAHTSCLLVWGNLSYSDQRLQDRNVLYWHHSYDSVGEKDSALTYEQERNTKHLYKTPLQTKELQITETQLRLLLQPFWRI